MPGVGAVATQRHPLAVVAVGLPCQPEHRPGMRAAASCDGLLRSRRLACTAVGGIPVRGCRAGITLAVAWRNSHPLEPIVGSGPGRPPGSGMAAGQGSGLP